MRIVYEHNGFYGQYGSESGFRQSSWRRPAKEKRADYVEGLPILKGSVFLYGVAGIRDEALTDSDEFDGWPKMLPADALAIGKPARRRNVGDLL